MMKRIIEITADTICLSVLYFIKIQKTHLASPRYITSVQMQIEINVELRVRTLKYMLNVKK